MKPASTNVDIVNVLKRIFNPDAVRFFFLQLRSMIQTLNISITDQRLTLALFQKGGDIGINANLVKRIALAIRCRVGRDGIEQKKFSSSEEMIFMVRENDYKKYKLERSWFSVNYSKEPKAKLVYFRFSEPEKISIPVDLLLKRWAEAYHDYFDSLNSVELSIEKRVDELHEVLYEMTFDDNLLEQYISEAK